MLKKIAKRIEKELAQAEDYCEQSMLVKIKAPSLSELFATLSSEEIAHAEKLLREGQRMVDDKHDFTYGREIKSGEGVESDEKWHERCKVIWEWEHRLAMDKIAEIKYKLQMYRGM